MNKTIVVAISGASGVIYGIRLMAALSHQKTDVHLIVSTAGKQALSHEAGYNGESLHAFLESKKIPFKHSTLHVYDESNFFAPPASGSFRHDGMVIAPCTMGSLGSIASGTAANLIHRAADVCLKEKMPLILLTRETPYNTIHIENMLKAAQAGATIMPPCPSFYTHPETIDQLVDTVVARVLDHLTIDHDLVAPWGTSVGTR